jgi:hypothetical protein
MNVYEKIASAERKGTGTKLTAEDVKEIMRGLCGYDIKEYDQIEESFHREYEKLRQEMSLLFQKAHQGDTEAGVKWLEMNELIKSKDKRYYNR